MKDHKSEWQRNGSEGRLSGIGAYYNAAQKKDTIENFTPYVMPQKRIGRKRSSI